MSQQILTDTERTDSVQWREQSERGSPFLMRLITSTSLRLGRPFGRSFLYPICLYFLATGGASKKASKVYLAKVLDREPTQRDIFRHYFYFASMILDRTFLLARKYDALEFELVGKQAADQIIARHGTCLYLGSHLGSFEVMRVVGADRGGHTINVLMYEENARKVSRILKELAPEESQHIIPLGGVNTLIAAKQCIDRKERLAILGDRIGFDRRMTKVPFFDEQVFFPSGPMMLASILDLPVILFFGVYLGKNRYRIIFEVFEEQGGLPRDGREQAINNRVARYAQRLEHHCRLAPFNWFNFYDFWRQGVNTVPN